MRRLSKLNDNIEILLNIPSSITVSILGILFVFLLIILAPVEIKYTGTSYSWLYVVVSVVALIVGQIFGSGVTCFKSKANYFSIDRRTLLRFFKFVLVLSTFGIL